MATEIVMPKVDMVMENGVFIEWLKNEGEPVKKGEPLFIISTDKANIEVEAPASGLLAGLGAKPDDVVPVSTVIGYIVQAGEAVPRGMPGTPDGLPAGPNLADQRQIPEVPIQKSLEKTQLARSLTRQMKLNLAEIPGSGPRGRIYKADVDRHVSKLETKSGGPVAQKEVATITLPTRSDPHAGIRERSREPLKGPRAVIAQRLTSSASSIPHIHLTIQVDMTETARLRQMVNPVLEKKIGLKASYTAIMARAVSFLLPQHPYLNSSLVGEEIVLWQDVHLGIAMNQDDHLIVPVIREAEAKSLEQIVKEIDRLRDLAGQFKLPPSEMTGSTFTISNLGMFGITSFTAIINPPEAAILAVGQIQETPVALNGQVVIRPMLSLTLAANHRLNDGVRVANFLSDLKRVLENPYLLI
ncbi:MAG: 2-oxo acid dehydrogenase subunit E2 [Chloroflexi bacterium]|nr:2-oxo acid dehydrogenase subunit E2 [Chloroflexota bacterium]